MRQVLRPGALGRPRGIGWRGRWEGGSEWGILVNPWLIHVNVRQKPLQYCKVISLQLIKINEKKRKIISICSLSHLIPIKVPGKAFSGSLMVKTSPSNAEDVGSIPDQGAKITQALQPREQNIRQKQYCKKFNKD